MGYDCGDFGGKLPDVIIYPTGRRRADRDVEGVEELETMGS